MEPHVLTDYLLFLLDDLNKNYAKKVDYEELERRVTCLEDVLLKPSAKNRDK